MDNNPIRSTAFGGFRKKDVAAYIEELSRNAAGERGECERLRERCARLEEQLAEYERLRPEQEALSARADELREENERLSAEVARLEEENAALAETAEAARRDAEVYQAAREHLAALEIESARRSTEIEREAKRKADEITRKSAEGVLELQMALDALRKETQRISVVSFAAYPNDFRAWSAMALMLLSRTVFIFSSPEALT